MSTSYHAEALRKTRAQERKLAADGAKPVVECEIKVTTF